MPKCYECKTADTLTDYAKYCSDACRMRKYRRTLKGQNAIIRNNLKKKRPDHTVRCSMCETTFVTARKNRKLCSKCSPIHSARLSRDKFRRENPEKLRCHTNFNKAVQRGYVEPMLCIKCGKEAEGHHPDYSKPYLVIWVCREHHHEIHAEFRAGKDISYFTDRATRYFMLRSKDIPGFQYDTKVRYENAGTDCRPLRECIVAYWNNFHKYMPVSCRIIEGEEVYLDPVQFAIWKEDTGGQI
jgi:hypothetical protein